MRHVSLFAAFLFGGWLLVRDPAPVSACPARDVVLDEPDALDAPVPPDEPDEPDQPDQPEEPEEQDQANAPDLERFEASLDRLDSALAQLEARVSAPDGDDDGDDGDGDDDDGDDDDGDDDGVD